VSKAWGLHWPPLPSQSQALAAGHLALPLAVLTLLNLLTFRNHYFGDFGFPSDFVQAYYGMGAFSVSALAAGELPEWMPYQCMGYPFLLNPQTGFFYPPLWLFAALGADYTLHAAVVLQSAHVLFGAIGAFFFARRLGTPPQLALVGAVAYHFFGGFYGNAEHVDIIRSFALIPWLLHGLTFDPARPALLGRGSLLLPLWVYLLATGGYVGNLIAASLAAALYLGLQVVERLRLPSGRREAVRAGALAGVLLAAGFAMAAVHLGPIWLNSGAFHRTATIESIRYSDLWSVGFGSLIFSSRALTQGGSIAMTSAFVTVPIFVLAFFVAGKELRARWPLVAVLAFAVLMSGGPRSLVWRTVATWIPWVRLSRFPTSDYRPLIALGLIAFGVLAVLSVLRGAHGLRNTLARSGLAVAAFSQIAISTYGSVVHHQVLWGLLVALASVALLAWLRGRGVASSWGAALALIALVGIDAWRVLPDMETWREPAVSAFYTTKRWSEESPWDLARSDGVQATTDARPAREEVGHPAWFSWAGYLQRRFMMADRAGCLLEASHEVHRSERLRAYMLRPWTPLLVDPHGLEWSETGPVLPPDAFEAASAPSPERGVEQLRYGLDEVSYAVRLNTPTIMVENEMYFPGWEATLEGPGHQRRLAAISANEVFRAWQLPAGSYRMEARFRTPGLRVSVAIALCGPFLWGAGILLWRRGYARAGSAAAWL
jgi:hypothetical protein